MIAQALVISSFSKYWGMTGWRLGWCLVPDDLVAAYDALAGNFALCPPVPAQHAAIAAFTESSYAEAAAAVGEFSDARTILLNAVGELGWSGVAPADGAFYVYADIGEPARSPSRLGRLVRRAAGAGGRGPDPGTRLRPGRRRPDGAGVAGRRPGGGGRRRLPDRPLPAGAITTRTPPTH